MPELVSTLRSCHRDLVRVVRRLAELEDDPKTAPGAVAAGQLVRLALGVLIRDFPPLSTELALDELIAAEGWEHPSQILDRPHPGFGEMLLACKERLTSAPAGEQKRLQEVHERLERAHRIEEAARERRERLRQASEQKTTNQGERDEQ